MPVESHAVQNFSDDYYFYRARYYEPGIGRFTQVDPLGYYADVNFYAYVRNNPIKYIDPLGLKNCLRQIKKDIARFDAAYAQFLKDPYTGWGQQLVPGVSGAINNLIYDCTLGNYGASCQAFATGLLTQFRPLQTDCCKPDDKNWLGGIHVYVSVVCRCSTESTDWTWYTKKYDPWKDYPPNPPPDQTPSPGLPWGP